MAAVRKASLASTNAHKAAELERVLTGWRIDVIDADYPPEVGETFEENALAKARFGRTLAPADAWVLGEDSGIEVEALGGEPGIRSARWAAGDEAGKMLAAMAGQDDRRARYVAALAAIAPDGSELVVRGTLEGRIAEAASGSEGFGYDPVFIPEGEDSTVAELGDGWKAAHSHRARAAQALREALERLEIA
jgi:XTP/dITP diphosphohydrolase